MTTSQPQCISWKNSQVQISGTFNFTLYAFTAIDRHILNREEIGYDGWRLDFVRGFWGGYVKDYLDATEPYFAVGEYWDSLSYTYGNLDPGQDAHRQRIIDWINATNGMAGAFDVTTKGILHAVRTNFLDFEIAFPELIYILVWH